MRTGYASCSDTQVSDEPTPDDARNPKGILPDAGSNVPGESKLAIQFLKQLEEEPIPGGDEHGKS